MHAHGVVNIESQGAAVSAQFAACPRQFGSQQACLRFSASTQRPFCLLPRRTSASKLKLVTVSRATVTSNGSEYPRQTVTSDRDGTLGPQSRVPTENVVALNSSASRPPLTPSVIRSYEVPLWGKSSSRATPVICNKTEIQSTHLTVVIASVKGLKCRRT